MKEVWAMVVGLLLMLFIIYLSYRLSRFLASRTGYKGRYMKEKDRLAMGPEQYISILRVGDGYYLVGVTKQNISILAEIGMEELKEIPKESMNEFTGKTLQSEFFKKLKGKVSDVKDQQWRIGENRRGNDKE